MLRLPHEALRQRGGGEHKGEQGKDHKAAHAPHHRSAQRSHLLEVDEVAGRRLALKGVIIAPPSALEGISSGGISSASDEPHPTAAYAPGLSTTTFAATAVRSYKSMRPPSSTT